MKKLDPHTRKHIFTGYGESSRVNAYKLFDPHTHKFFFNQSVIFDEISVLEQQKQHEVRDFKQNLKINDLITPNVSQIKNYDGLITKSFSKQFQNRKHADVLAKDEDVVVTHYLYNNSTYPNKKALRSPYKDYLCDQIGNEDIHNVQTKDHEKKYHKNHKTYKDILVKDSEKVASRNGSRWRMKNPERRQNEEVEFIHRSLASTLMMKPHEGQHFRHDRHDHPPQIQHDHSQQNQNDDHLHDEQLGHLQNQLGHDQFHHQNQLRRDQHDHQNRLGHDQNDLWHLDELHVSFFWSFVTFP